MKSLNRRILLSATLVLAIFLMLTALALERAFVESARAARQDRLLGQLYLLIAAAEVDGAGRLHMPETLTEARFSLPGSGLYAAIADAQGKTVWRSQSVLHVQPPFQSQLAPGEKRFTVQADYFAQSLGVKWAVGRASHAFTFSVSEHRAEFDAQMRRYRQSLWGWLAGLALLLLLAQAAVLRWGLRPLRQVAGELRAIESGRQERVIGKYPEEIQNLTNNLNGVLEQERVRQQRYRDALADLAHSLKTPLAVMRGALGQGAQALPQTVEEQVARMDDIVAYQLQRAATAGPRALHIPPLPLRAPLQKIMDALSKVYAEKQVQVEIQLTPENLAWAMEQGDCLELLGNLLENAFKWCAHRIRVRGGVEAGQAFLVIEDDGPGIAPQMSEQILLRGVRADQAVPGHGIGLAVVRDIVDAYAGELLIGVSEFGGAALRICLAQRG